MKAQTIKDLSIIPESFRKDAQTCTQKELANMYDRSPATISIWCKSLGIKTPKKSGAYIRDGAIGDTPEQIAYCLRCTRSQCSGVCPFVLNVKKAHGN